MNRFLRHASNRLSVFYRMDSFVYASILFLIASILPFSAFAQYAYVPIDGVPGTVSAINLSTHSITNITVGNNPTGVSVSPDGLRAYIGNAGDYTVSVIDTSTNNVIGTYPLAGYTALPYAIAVSTDNATLYVSVSTSSGDEVLVLNAATGSTIATIPVAAGPTGIAVSPDGARVYVASYGSGLDDTVTVINTSNNTVVRTLHVGNPAYSVAVTPDSTQIYVTSFIAAEVIDASTFVVSLTNYGAGTTVSISRDGRFAYFADSVNNTVDVIDTATQGIGFSDSIPVGDDPWGIATTTDGSQVWVGNLFDNTMSVIDTASNLVVGTISLANSPDGVGIFIQPTWGSGGIVPAQNPKLLGKQPCCSVSSTGASASGEPIDVASGNMEYGVPDYVTAGQNPLAFSRYYNSRENAPGIVTFANELGVNWRSNFDRYLQLISPTQVTVERADGKQYVFTLIGSTWTPDTDVDITLVQAGTSWTLTDHDDTAETYTTASAGNVALLNTIQSRNGYTQTLHRNGGGQLTSVTDSYSRALSFTYNGNGTINTAATPDSTTLTYGYNTVTGGIQLTSVSYSTTPASHQTYSYTQPGLPFALTGITDENGNSYATWTYDSYGRGLTSQLGSGANFTQMSYTGTQTIVTNAFGVQDTYSFTTLQNVPKITLISRAATSTTAAATETFGYDSSGYINSQTDWNGNQTTQVNNSHGDPTTITEAVGTPVQRITTIAYDTTHNCVHLPHSVATTGVTTSYSYDSRCDTLTKTLTDTTSQSIPYPTNGETETWTYSWNNYLLASVETPNLKTTNYYYSASGALTKITNPLSQSTNITSYTGGGYPQTIVDRNSVTTTLTWNARQWLMSSAIATTSGVLTTTYTLDPAGELTQLTLPDNSFLSYDYDHAHRLTNTYDADNNEIEYTLDALGNKTQIDTYNSSDTLVRQHSATFDALGRTLTDVGGVGQTTSFSYDPNGNQLTVTDALLNETIRTFDQINRLSTSTDANTGVTQFTYDAHDRILTAEDPDNNTTSYAYDGFGNAIQQASPDSGTSVYHYDADNNQTQKIDALSIATNNTFDALDRIKTTQYPADPTLNVAYTYDQTGTGYGFGIGQLTSLTDAAGSLTRSYDERGNMLINVRTNGASIYTTSYSFDPASRIASITYPSGSLITNLYDIAGYLQQVKAKPPGSPTATTLATLTHLPFGPINSAGYGNGVSESWSFDEDYRSTNITDVHSATTLQNLTYGYDADNNVKTITDAVNAANGQTLGYDVLNRINSAVSGTGGYGSLSWTYDKNGNVKTFKVGSATTSYTYTSSTNRLATITGPTITKIVGTNANGNITSIPPANGSTNAGFTYSAANRLASVSGVSTPAAFVYDAFGQRFSKADSGGTPVTYAYSQAQRLIEENKNGIVADYIYADGRPLSVLKIGMSPVAITDYILADRLGTPQLATSGSAATVWATTYQPYGTTGPITGTTTQNLRLPGQSWDNETGFYYNIQRDYMPNIGRYLETDPIGLVSGLNTYGYVDARPLNQRDLWGTFNLPYGFPLLPPERPGQATIDALNNGYTGSYDASIEDPLEEVVFGAPQLFLLLNPLTGPEDAVATVLLSTSLEEATNAADAQLLRLSLASAAQICKPRLGKAIAGAGTKTPIDDINRLLSEYGGLSPDWAKMTSSSFVASDGQILETHWYENIQTGQQVELKSILKYPPYKKK